MINTKYLIFLMIITNSWLKNYAVLSQNARYFYNYRMLSNNYGIYQNLIGSNFDNNKINFLNTDNCNCHRANYPYGKIRNIDNDKKSYLNKGVEDQNFVTEDANLIRHLNSFNGRYQKYDTLYKRPNLDSSTNVFIYLSGHGGNDYVKIQYFDILFTKIFGHFIKDLEIRNKYNKLLVINDSCGAGTLFTSSKVRDSLLLGSSGLDQNGLSEGNDKLVGQPVKDKFSYKFWLLMNNKKNDFNFKNLKDTTPRSYLECDLQYFNKLNKNENSIDFKEFLVAEKEEYKIITEKDLEELDTINFD